MTENEKIVRAIVHLEDFYESMDVGHTHKRTKLLRVINDLRAVVGWERRGD